MQRTFSNCISWHGHVEEITVYFEKSPDDPAIIWIPIFEFCQKFIQLEEVHPSFEVNDGLAKHWLALAFPGVMRQ